MTYEPIHHEHYGISHPNLTICIAFSDRLVNLAPKTSQNLQQKGLRLADLCAAERHRCRSLAQTLPAMDGVAASLAWRFSLQTIRVKRWDER